MGEQNCYGFLDFLLQTVFKIVMHLLDKLVVGKRIQVNIVGIGHRRIRRGGAEAQVTRLSIVLRRQRKMPDATNLGNGATPGRRRVQAVPPGKNNSAWLLRSSVGVWPKHLR